MTRSLSNSPLKIFSRFGLFILAVLGSPIAIASLTPAEIQQALIGKSDAGRANAIASMARSGQISSPISGFDGAAILEGATQGARASAIAELAPLFKADISGQEAAAILGPSTVLSDVSRANAIAALARAKRFGPSLGEDAALALKGATQGSRAAAIAEIAPYLRGGLSGQALAAIVGPASDINDISRANAIAALARSAKRPAPISGFDGAAILEGATQGARASAIAELAPLFKADISGQEAAAILGPSTVLSDVSRANAIAALVKAGKLHASIAVDEHLPLIAQISPNPIPGSGKPQTLTLTAGNFDSDFKIHVKGSGLDQDISHQKISLKGPSRIELQGIVTSIQPDNWNFTIVNAGGKVSAPFTVPILECGSRPARTSTKFGAAIGDVGGVKALSNGICAATALGNCDLDINSKHQCVEYVKKFYSERISALSSMDVIWTSAMRFWQRPEHDGFTVSELGSSRPPRELPKPGDIIFFKTDHPEGHVAIVMDTDAEFVSVVQQNIRWDTAYAKIAYQREIDGTIQMASEMIFPDGCVSQHTMIPVGWLSLKPAPIVTGISPNPVPALATGQKLTIHGDNFDNGLTVHVKATGVNQNLVPKKVTFKNATELDLFEFITGAVGDRWIIEVINPGGRKSGEFQFNTIP